MEFTPQSTDETDNESKSKPTEEEEVIACPATLGGCSSDGVCSFGARKRVEARMKELGKVGNAEVVQVPPPTLETAL